MAYGLLLDFLYGQAIDSYKYFGAHFEKKGRVKGVMFRLYAPSADDVSVIGEWNNWDVTVNKMAKVDYKDLATKLLSALGGADNIVEAQNCMTRLRCVVKDPKKVNVPDIKKVDGVLQVINDGSLLQVVLGLGRAQKITTEFNELVKKQKEAK